MDEEEMKLKLEMCSKRNELDNNLKEILIARSSALSNEILKMESAISAAQLKGAHAIVDIESANILLNSVLLSLHNNLQELFDLLRSTKSPHSIDWFFRMNFQPFWMTVKKVCQDIQAQIQKIFKEGNPEEMRSLEKRKQWLKILRGSNLKCELSFCQSEVEYEGMKAKLKAAQNILDDMDSKSFESCLSSDVSKERLQKLEKENKEFFELQISPRVAQKCDLIRDCIAASQNATELKKMEQSTKFLQMAISKLTDINARIEFIFAVFAMEHEFLTEIGSFMNKLNEYLQGEVQRFNTVKLTVEELCSKPPRPTTQFEEYVNNLGKILGLKDSQKSVTEKLAAIDNELSRIDAERIAIKEAIDSKLNQEVSLLTKMDSSLDLLTSSIWQDGAMHTIVPPLTPSTISRALLEISENFAKAGATFVDVSDEKLKKTVMLQADSSQTLKFKRRLYSYFYADHASFKRACEAIVYNTTKRSDSESEEEA